MIYKDIHEERLRAHAKHAAAGNSMEGRPWSDPYWLPVLVEEVGEVAQQLCDMRSLAASVESERQGLEWLRSELVQVAAMATAWIDAVDNALHGEIDG